MSNKEKAAAYLWSGQTSSSDFSLIWRIVFLPLYLTKHAYHCIRGTPVYIQYGNHEKRRTQENE